MSKFFVAILKCSLGWAVAATLLKDFWPYLESSYIGTMYLLTTEYHPLLPLPTHFSSKISPDPPTYLLWILKKEKLVTRITGSKKSDYTYVGNKNLRYKIWAIHETKKKILLSKYTKFLYTSWEMRQQYIKSSGTP